MNTKIKSSLKRGTEYNVCHQLSICFPCC